MAETDEKAVNVQETNSDAVQLEPFYIAESFQIFVHLHAS